MLCHAFLICADVDDKFWIRAKIHRKLAFDLVQSEFLPLHEINALRIDLDCSNIFFANLCVRLAINLGQMQFQPFFEQRGRDDEDDQQHKRKVQQGGDVDLAQRHKGIAL